MIALRASDCLSRKTFAGLERLVLAVVGPKNKRAFGLSQFMVTKVATSVQRTRWLVTIPRGVFGLANFRPGVATQFVFGRYRDCSTAALRCVGRWASEISLASHLQEAVSMFVWTKLADATTATLSALIRSGSAC
jgi:hypothetical protein